jgi:type II secretory pathway pseudopilin PulG
MKNYSGFTLLEILLYVVIGGVTLAIAVFSFAQLNRLSTSFRVNNELNQTGSSIIEQIQNIINEADTIISPKLADTSDNTIVLRKGNRETIITQSVNNIVVSYSDSTPSFNLNPTGILVVNTPKLTLLFEQINTQNNDNNTNISQAIKLKFTLRYNKPAFSSFEYEAEKSFETTLKLSKKVSGFEPILNKYPTGANGVAYSLRKIAGLNTNPNVLSSTYNGSAIKVMRYRGLDQTEMDIGFNSKGELDTMTLQNFVGYQNLFNYSEDITNTTGGWSLNNVTTISDNTIAPDGTNTAEKVNLSAGNNNKSISKNTNLTSGSIYTDSYYVRAKDHNNDGNFNNDDNFVQIAPDINFFPTNITTPTAYQNYNLRDNGILANKSNDNDIIENQSKIEKVGNNGWYRICLSYKAERSNSGGMVLSILNADIQARVPAINITTATDSIFVWGGMRHLSNSLTSPPKTYQKTLANVNTGDGYITTWYDQSGNNNNAIQTNTSAQPKIVDGVTGIVLQNGKPAIRFDGSDDQLVSTSFNNATNSTAFFIASRGANNQSFMSRSTNYATLGATDLFNPYYLNKSSTAAATESDSKNILNLYTAIRTSDISSILNIGAGSAGNFLNGHISELIIYDGNKLDNKLDIENNLRDYYGTP